MAPTTRTLGHLLERLLTEMGPLVVFFVTTRAWDILVGTAALMAATAIAVLLSLAREKRVPVLPLVGLAFTLLFGAITLVWSDPTFIKVRPTVYNAAAGLALVAGLMGGRLLLKALFDTGLGLGDGAWRALTWRVVAFFLALAVLNEVLRHALTTADWVAFKAFGMPLLNALFLAANWPFVRRRLRPGPEGEPPRHGAASARAPGR